MPQNQDTFGCAIVGAVGVVGTFGVFFSLILVLALWAKAQAPTTLAFAAFPTFTPTSNQVAIVQPQTTAIIPTSTIAPFTADMPLPTDTPLLISAPTDIPLLTSTPIPIPTDMPSLSPDTAWYAGGTLHNATIAEWRMADHRNKLATSADWAALGFDLHSMAEYEIYAPELLTCIDSAFDTYASLHPESFPINDLMLGCIIGMKNPD